MKAAVSDVVSMASPNVGSQACEIKTCLLLSKPLSPTILEEDKPSFVAITDFPSVWLVGFGLDADQQCRGWCHLFGRCQRETAAAGRKLIIDQLNKMRHEIDKGML
eukprot:gnl/Chilomastix_caulleri/2281.p1 GENE.gnl/Chilomastix_caulleri/2281~~gnl/Chilomastix_caulleri/2281.p1  ORF type:complete len:106 (-),score=5.03 gnl/Chilomastix_caulleri/2281:129-446(-)